MRRDPDPPLADDPDLNDYQHQPVENYGLTMLAAMGFTKERGIGQRKSGLTEPLVLKARPRGLGLGAEQEAEAKKPQFEVGNYVQFTAPPHQGLIAIVLQVRQTDLSLQLKKSGSQVRSPFTSVKLISPSDLSQLESTPHPSQSKKKRLKWIVPGIRVKVTSKQSKYYLRKVVVTELLSEREFECLYVDEGGRKKFIKELAERDVQSVVAAVGGEVVVVKGKHRGERGRVMAREKKQEKVVVQTHNELELLTLDEDEVCEYVDL